MSENAKTLVFVAIAAFAAILAWEPWDRELSAPTQEQLAGTKVFPDFDDPLSAKRMEIVEYDNETASLRPFSVAQVNGVWSIPSHQSYPADAREHLAEAATSVIGLEILNVVGSSPGEHESFGVIDPDIKTLKPGTEGVGTRVTLKDSKGNKLADLIVGKAVKDKPDLRYVRKARQDQVFVVSMKTDKLSTKFENWIERDLLKLNSFDIGQVQFNNYSIETQLTEQGVVGFPVFRSRIKVGYDDSKSAWNLLDLTTYKENKPSPAKLGPDEELNSEKLNAMKTALDDLQIVDVEKKPAGLSVDLRASEEFVKNQEAARSLSERGFHAYRSKDKIDVLSNEGEVIVGMKDGVEYVLRFGEIAGTTAAKKEDASAAAKQKKDKDASGSNVSRYLFVTARFNENLIEKPKLEALPGEAAAGKPQAAGAARTPRSEAAASEGKQRQPGADANADETNQEGNGDQDSAQGGASNQQRTGGRIKFASDSRAKPRNPATKPAAKPAPPAPAEAAAATPEATGPPDATKPASSDGAKRKEIEKENKRKEDDYQAKVKKGQERVAELNDRFADWYYHISDEVYQKIHLDRDEIIKKKEVKAGEGDKVSDLKELEKGLDEAAPPK